MRPIDVTSGPIIVMISTKVGRDSKYTNEKLYYTGSVLSSVQSNVTCTLISKTLVSSQRNTKWRIFSTSANLPALDPWRLWIWEPNYQPSGDPCEGPGQLGSTSRPCFCEYSLLAILGRAARSALFMNFLRCQNRFRSHDYSMIEMTVPLKYRGVFHI